MTCFSRFFFKNFPQTRYVKYKLVHSASTILLRKTNSMSQLTLNNFRLGLNHCVRVDSANCSVKHHILRKNYDKRNVVLKLSSRHQCLSDGSKNFIQKWLVTKFDFSLKKMLKSLKKKLFLFFWEIYYPTPKINKTARIRAKP